MAWYQISCWCCIVLQCLLLNLLLLESGAYAYKNQYYDTSSLCARESKNLPYLLIDGAVLTSGEEDSPECVVTFRTDSILQKFMLRFEMLALNCADRLLIFEGSHTSNPKVHLSCLNTTEDVQTIFTMTNFVTVKFVPHNRIQPGTGFRMIITSVQDIPSTKCTGFECQNKLCISKDLKCDGVNHCGDDSDETRHASCAGYPFFEQAVERLTLEPSVRNEILCNASGNGPIEYTWYDEYGQKIDVNSNNSVYSYTTQRGSYLVIDDLISSSSFNCSASNKQGQASKTYEISVKENPLINNISIRNITDSSVTFHVTTNKDAQEVLIYFSEFLENRNKSRNVTTLGATDLNIEMKDLVAGGRYRFHFKAASSNEKYSEEWELPDVVLLPSAPEVVVMSHHSGFLKIQWIKEIYDARRKAILDYTISYASVFLKRDFWVYSSCLVNITVPSCAPSSFTISDLSPSSYYEVQVKARTISGYGGVSKFKVYVD